MKQRILLVTQYFYPESFKSNDIAFELVKKGYEVDALVSIPNYPAGEYYKEYGVFSKRIQLINGVRVYRAFQTPRGKKASGISLSFNYLTYAFFASLWALTMCLFKKYDKIVVFQTSPITQALPALVINKLRNTPIYIWVQDLWPDAMKSGGGVKNVTLLNIVDRFVKLVYRKSARIMISSKQFSELICLKGNFEEKIVYLPNWCDDILEMEMKQIPIMPEGFIIMMAGNLGTAQTLDAVMQVAVNLKDVEDVKWVFVGDGSRKEWLDGFIEDNQLQNTVFAFGRYSFDYMAAFFDAADALLITLRAEFPHLRAVVPSRLQSYMASGKPILGMIDGGAAEIISAADCGYCVEAENPKALEEIIRSKVLTSKADFSKKGQNGRLYYERHFMKDTGINNLINILFDKA